MRTFLLLTFFPPSLLFFSPKLKMPSIADCRLIWCDLTVRFEDIVIDGSLAMECFGGDGLSRSVLDSVEADGRYIVAVTPMPSLHSFPSPANLSLSFATRTPKFVSAAHRVTDLRAEGNPFDPGYSPGSHTTIFSSGSFVFELQAVAPTLLLVEPITSFGEMA